MLENAMRQEKQQHAEQLAGLRKDIRKELEESIGQPLPPDAESLLDKVDAVVVVVLPILIDGA